MRTQGVQGCTSTSMANGNQTTGRPEHAAWIRIGSAPVTLTDAQLERTRCQLQSADRCNELLADLRNLAPYGSADPGEGSTSSSNDEADAVVEIPAADASARSQTWMQWTAALIAVRGAQGGISTFVGRIAQEALRIGVGSPERPEQVSDGVLAAGAALNLGIGLMEGVRAGVHAMRASRSPREYAAAFRGFLPAAGAAGTPSVPTGVLCRAATSFAVGTAVFAAASHTGLIALAHLGSDCASKPDAYKTVWQSNGNAVYAYTREIINAAIDGVGFVSHHALLNGRGAVVSTGQYFVNAMGQLAAQEALQLGRSPEFDIRWPAISAVAEVIDVATVAGASRFASPEAPVRFLRGRLSELPPETPHSPPSRNEVIDRILLRGASRHLVAEVAQHLPRQIGTALQPHLSESAESALRRGSVFLQSPTHLREMMWQAESVVISQRQRTNAYERVPDSDPSASALRQNIDDIV